MKLKKLILDRLRWLRAASIPRRLINKKRIAYCYAIRDRVGQRLDNSLASVRQLSLDQKSIDIVLCDMGSAPDNVRLLRELAAKYGAKLVLLHQPVADLWHKTWVMNVAIRQVSPDVDYITATDADVIFAREFAVWTLRAHYCFSRGCFVCCAPTDLPQHALPYGVAQAELEELRLSGQIQRDAGIGVCQSFSANWIREVRGYDERFKLQFYEDNDMEKRASRGGLWTADLTKKSYILHQWHETVPQQMKIRGQQDEYEFILQANREYFERSDSVVRNPHDWGCLPASAEVKDCGGVT